MSTILMMISTWRELERGIRLRPVYHWVAHRIPAHVRLSVT